MKINELYDKADRNNIAVHYFHMNGIISMSLPNHIAIDVDAIENTAEEKIHLAHELGHCVRGAFYRQNSPYDLKSRHEYKADKWAVKKLVPFDELKEALEIGITERFELAEYFEVTEQFIEKALKMYEDKLIVK